MSLGKVPVKAGGGAKWKASLELDAGIHGNPESGYHHQVPSHSETQWRYLPTSNLKLLHKCTIWSSKLHNLSEQVCVIWNLAKTCMLNRGAWSENTVNQHGLNFNLA